MSKGPFRPYTVLSARALATFLASEDQPEKGLCPNGFIQSDNSQPSKSNSGQRRGQYGHNAFQISKSPENSKMIHDSSKLNKSFAMALPTYTDASIQADTSRANSASEESSQKWAHSEAAKSMLERSRQETQTHRKDTKSFSQSLFDTTVMKVLHLGDAPTGLLRWMRGTAPGLSDFSPANCHRTENRNGVHWDDVENSDSREGVVESSEVAESSKVLEGYEDTRGAHLPQSHAASNSKQVGLNDGETRLSSVGMTATNVLEADQCENCDGKKSPKTSQKFMMKTSVANEPSPPPMKPSPEDSEHSLMENDLADGKSQDLENM